MPQTVYWTGASSGLWTTVGNWVESDGTAPAAVPGTGDSVVFDARAVNPLTGSPASTIRLVKVQVMHSCPTTAYIGTPLTPVAAAVDSFIVGEDDNNLAGTSGCQQVCWNFGSTASGYSGTTVRILKTNTTGLNGLEVVQLQGTHSSNKMYVEGQSLVGWGTAFPGQSYTLSQCNITGSGARVNLGSGGTLTTVYQSNGTSLINCAFTTGNIIGGTLETKGTGAITTVNVGGNGIFIGGSTGTITTLAVNGSGYADFSKTSLARTVTTATINGAGKINANNGQARSVTFTNNVSIALGSSSNQMEFGGGLFVQQSAS